MIYIPNGGKNKWTPGVIDPNAPRAKVLSQALVACQLGSVSNAGHQRGGNCGEPMAVMAYLQDNPEGALTGGKVVTWGPLDKQKTKGVMNPCATDLGTDIAVRDWGCGQTMRTLHPQVFLSLCYSARRGSIHLADAFTYVSEIGPHCHTTWNGSA